MPIEVPRTTRLDWAPVREHVRAHGMRNSNTMAVAPTATIANIAGCFPCIEPIYKNIYVKANISGEFTVVNDYLVRDLKALGLWTDDTLDQLKYFDGNVQMIAAIPERLKQKYREAFEIDADGRAAADRGARQVDRSEPVAQRLHEGHVGQKLSETYLAAWRLGLKTTYYLRTLAASQIEKSTLDASKFGFTQTRDYTECAAAAEGRGCPRPCRASPRGRSECADHDPDCEACQC